MHGIENPAAIQKGVLPLVKKVKVKLSDSAEQDLAEEIRKTISSKGLEIECAECGKKFMLTSNPGLCPYCGIEYRL